MGQPTEVVPLHWYFVPPTGFHLPLSSLMNRQHGDACLAPTGCGACMPFAVQSLTPLRLEASALLVSLPPSWVACWTKSRAADQAKSPKNEGVAPGFTCWSQLR